MFGSRDTQAIRLLLNRIARGEELNRRSMHIKVVNVGNFYYVQHWNTRIAIGERGELPFVMTTQGWTTKTTLNYLRALGFKLETKRISLGKYRNPQTHRMVNNFARVVHIDGHPMLDERGCVDYDSWYGHGGIRLDVGPNFF